MKRTSLVLAALLLAPAGAQAQGGLAIRNAPPISDLLSDVCVPLFQSGDPAVAAKAAEAKGFKLETMAPGGAMLSRGIIILIMSNGDCGMVLSTPSKAAFLVVSNEIAAWMPNLGKFTSTSIETDGDGLRSKSYVAAAGATLTVKEYAGNKEREIHFTMLRSR